MSNKPASEPQSVPSIPRQAWEQHPHFRTQTLLLGSHENFRDINARLIEWAQGDASDTVIAALYFRWIAAMRSHEAYEEHKLYPYLAHRWGADFSAAQAGHDALHEADREVRRALVRVVDPDAEAGPDVLDALRAHDTALRAHLEIEESLVIPMLLELSPHEFERYATLPIEDLLPQRTG